MTTPDAGQRLIEDLRKFATAVDITRQVARRLNDAANFIERLRGVEDDARQVEQLQARVDAAEKLIPKWRSMSQRSPQCAYELASALTAPTSSAPTDPGRAEDKS